ncbi:hypothetical protein N7517_003164 [Penicillium concentricum]|uniref:Uncharacterized protein n=1 Tax=Penicillium concentricum TaxID=293559 RepID=A0A9W9VK62_9EURO|nr:uncharacterized protein N7517_003164 [Penicillium concentricum]KAJ5385253.1 hypothetical protein N7517_003164 [Penicillium concentricum]
MFFQRTFLGALLLLAIPRGVLSRRGHDSDIDSDTSSSSDSTSDTSSSSDDTTTSTSSGSGYTCPGPPELDYYLIGPTHYQTYQDTFEASDYDGVYYIGEATFNYKLDVPPVPTTTYFVYTPKATCPAGWQSLRMRALAWVAPKTPEPAGPKNPITIAFQALPNVADSYSRCSKVDRVGFSTTVDWSKRNTTGDTSFEAIDSVKLDIRPTAGNDNMVDFDGVYDISAWKDRPKDFNDPTLFQHGQLRRESLILPAGTCSGSSGREKLDLGYPSGAIINGSLTNETIQLNVSGFVVAWFRDDNEEHATTNVTYNIVFTGAYDAANSSRLLVTGAASSNESLVSFQAPPEGSGTVTGASWKLAVISLVASIGLALV